MIDSILSKQRTWRWVSEYFPCALTSTTTHRTSMDQEVITRKLVKRKAKAILEMGWSQSDTMSKTGIPRHQNHQYPQIRFAVSSFIWHYKFQRFSRGCCLFRKMSVAMSLDVINLYIGPIGLSDWGPYLGGGVFLPINTFSRSTGGIPFPVYLVSAKCFAYSYQYLQG